MAQDGSYTVVIVPLPSSLYSLDALHHFHWLRKLQTLERERDSLCMGLQDLDEARLWYRQRLDHVPQRQAGIGLTDCQPEDGWSCMLRSRMLRLNGSLGQLLDGGCVWSTVAPHERDSTDWELRWSNATLAKEVSQKNQQISLLELEKDVLIRQRDCMYYF
ncbi:suppressor APC domain-containing protein 1 [Brachyhypopomus gauderio]|uniref:suppressor APC domain-containing protein 1 n=1 Tax=Brachyhypopomus gauderio TaxID=698409 RepID=UPI004041A534